MGKLRVLRAIEDGRGDQGRGGSTNTVGKSSRKRVEMGNSKKAPAEAWDKAFCSF